VGLSRTTILFIVSSGMSLILGVLRIPNVAHGSLYMIGAFAAWSVIQLLGGGLFGFLAAMLVAPMIVAAVGFVLERGFFSYLYEREHLMLLLLTFSFALILGDLVKIVWGPEYRSVTVPAFFQGSAEIFGLPLPWYNLFLLVIGPCIAVFLWLVINRTNLGKIARAAAVDGEMVGAVGINTGWIFAFTFVLGSFLAGLGGRSSPDGQHLPRHGPFADHGDVPHRHHRRPREHVGGAPGLAHLRLTQSLGILVWPQFGIAFPYLAVVAVLVVRPRGLLRSTW